MIRFATNEQEVVNPPCILHRTWNVLYQGSHQEVGTVRWVVDGSEVPFDIPVAQLAQAIAVVAVPSAHVLDLGISLLNLAKEGFLIRTVRPKLDVSSHGVGS